MIFGSYAIRISWTGKFSRNIREYAVLIPKMLYYYTIIMYETQGRIYIGMTGVGTLPLWFLYMGYIPLFWLYFFFKKCSCCFAALFSLMEPHPFHQTLDPPLKLV